MLIKCLTVNTRRNLSLFSIFSLAGGFLTVGCRVVQKYRLHVRRIPSTSAAAAAAAAPANGTWVPQVQCGDLSKKNISQSGSPQGPLHLSGSAKGVSGTGGDSMEYDEDDKSEGRSWKDA